MRGKARTRGAAQVAIEIETAGQSRRLTSGGEAVMQSRVPFEIETAEQSRRLTSGGEAVMQSRVPFHGNLSYLFAARSLDRNFFATLFSSGQLMKQTQTGDSQMRANGKERPRARDLGITVGILPTGTLNAITDVGGVMVGHTTIVRGENVRTGVTAILPHKGNLFRQKVAGAVFVSNGFGKLIGSTQIEELGEIETPILLTSTLSVPRAGDALISYVLSLPGNEDVRSVNPLVAETNDGFLNDIRGRHISADDVVAAIRTARSGPVEEGCVGAGTGTIAFGFKAGIGTASRKLSTRLGGYTVGVLVQTNFGGVLTINGAPVGRALGRYYLREELEANNRSKENGLLEEKHSLTAQENDPDGSIIIVVATDAPLAARNLKRLAARAVMGLARTGATGSNGSGDYAIAFSTSLESVASRVSGQANRGMAATIRNVPNDEMSPLFLAVIEATEEAIYNSLFRAATTTGRGHTVQALPIEQTVEILRRHNALSPRQ
jgi:D-aminopeptidase